MSAWLRLVPAWAWVALAGLVLVGVQQARVAYEQDARLADAGKLGACRETRSTLLVQVGEQNQELADLRAAEQARVQRAEVAQQQARRDAEQDYQAANRLQRERTGGDACPAAEAVINQELGL